MSRRLFYWIDHTGRYDGNSGVQRVVRSLARALEKRGRDIAYVGWDPGAYALIRAGRHELGMLSRYSGPSVRTREHAGSALHLNDLDEGELEGAWLLVPEVTYLGSGNQKITADIVDYCRSKGMKVAFIFYDMIPLLVKGYEDVRAAHSEYLQQLALSDLLISISEYSEKMLRAHYLDTLRLPLSELPEIITIPLAEAFGDARRPSVSSRPTDGRTRIISLGTIEPRKNQIKLLQAFNRLCERRDDLELHIVGHLHPLVAAQFNALCQANPRVSYRRYLSDEQVIDLYDSAAFTVFPSREEGYGLPIVESLWFGKPAICANFGAMAENARAGGCLTVDVNSEEALGEAIAKLASEPAKLAALSEEAASRSFKSWDTYAGEIETQLSRHTPLRRVWCFVESTLRTRYNSGVQRVARALGRTMQGLGVDVRFVRWDSDKGDLRELSVAESIHLAKWSGPTPSDNTQPAEPRPGDWLIVPEILLPPGPSASDIMAAARKRGMRTSFILFDLIPLKLSPKWRDARAAPIYQVQVAETFETFWRQVADADAILPISHAVADDLLGYLKRTVLKQNNLDIRVQPALLAGDFAGRPRERSARPTRKFTVLNVGTLEPRKNQLRLVRAFRTAADRPGAPSMRLVMAGSHRPYPEFAAEIEEEAKAADNVEFVEEVNDEQLADLYRNADIVTYASYEEGFGLPILESLWFGRACVSHNEGALAETAAGGGVLTVDMLDETQIAEALYRLATQPEELEALTTAAQGRSIRTWSEYAAEVLQILARLSPPSEQAIRKLPAFRPMPFAAMKHPLLSICVTTYNRAPWLKHSLKRILDLTRPYRDVIEIVVCDNAATDETPELVAEMQKTEDFVYFRNPKNVGMLGNLGVTAQHARGEYVWVFGDDDIMVAGVIENVLEGLIDNPDAEMVYLNYAYTNFNEPDELENIDQLVASATAIAAGGPNRYVPRLREVASLNENFFTAIYACIFRRNHAIRAYAQNVQGPPFSTLLRCVPSTVYGMGMMLDLPAYWIGEPGVVVNMNVSWKEWLLLWHLERMPELYDWAEREGMSGPRVDHYRWNHAADAAGHIRKLYFEAADPIRDNFDIRRFISRTLHLDAFRATQLPRIREVYREAHAAGKLKSDDPTPDQLFAMFDLPR